MANLSVKVTSEGIEKTEKGLERVGKAGDNTEKRFDKLEKKNKKLKKSVKELQAGNRDLKKSLEELKKPTEDNVNLENKLAKASLKGAGAIATVTAASIAAANALAKQVIETDNLARVSGLTIDQFEATSFAATQYGLQVDTVGAAFKDTKERLGEFIATGGEGAFNDFADTLGLTADEAMKVAKEIEQLSGRDALIKMVSELENAGASTNEISFALEGMAGDLTFLLPLLSDNGRELDRLSSSMDALTVPLTDEDVRTFRNLSEATDLAKGALGSLITKAVIPAIQPLADLTNAVAFFFGTLNEGTEAQLSSQLVDLNQKAKELQNTLDTGVTGGKFIRAIEGSEKERLLSDLDEVNQKIKDTQEQLSTIRFGTTGLVDETKEVTFTVNDQDNGKSENLALKRAEIERKREEQRNAEKAERAAKAAAAEEARKQESIDRQVESIRQGLLTEEELQLENFNKQQELITQSTLSEEQQAALLTGVWEAYYDDVALKAKESAEKRAEEERKLTQEKQKLEEQQRKDALGALNQTTSDLGAVLGEQSGLYKAAAITNATINTYEAATGAYKALVGITPIGPFIAPIAAAAAVAAGLGNIAKIKSARAQGGMVNRGDSVLVGERGPEVVNFSQSGRVIPNHQMGGSSSTTVNIYNQAQGVSVREEQRANGDTDLYITRDEFNDGLAAAAANPNSDLNQGLQGLYRLDRG